MRSPHELQKLLPTIPRISVSGPWTRALAHKYTVSPPPGSAPGTLPNPLWSGGAAQRGARFTPIGGFDSIYLAADPITALMEVSLVFQIPNAPPFTIATPPWVVFAVVGVVTETLDLCDVSIQAALKTNLQELTGHWSYPQSLFLNNQGPIPPTQVLGQAAYDSGMITGIRYPSAKQPQSSCLVVFPGRLGRSSQNYLRVYDPGGSLRGQLP
jgi:RES domain-containing protein